MTSSLIFKFNICDNTCGNFSSSILVKRSSSNFFILSVFITNPFDISSVKSDNLFGEISDNTDEIAASIKANMIRNLNSFRLFVSL